MDENLAKALIIVSGILLSMLLIAVLLLSMNKIGNWAKSEDDEKLIEQAQEFNKEYEAYDKDLMYGVDVISCLNKALSNNDKVNDGYMYGERVDSSYAIKVSLTLKKGLGESLIVYHLNNNNKEIEYTTGYGTSVNLGNMKPQFSFWNTEYLSGYSKDNLLKSSSKENGNYPAGKYTLSTDSSEKYKTDILEKLMAGAPYISETVKNSDSSTYFAEDGWTKATFRTALYDLKTRKFKCVSIKYEGSHGRINYIEFQEY